MRRVNGYNQPGFSDLTKHTCVCVCVLTLPASTLRGGDREAKERPEDSGSGQRENSFGILPKLSSERLWCNRATLEINWRLPSMRSLSGPGNPGMEPTPGHPHSQEGHL